MGCYSSFEVNDGFDEIDPHKYSALFKPFRYDEDQGIAVKAYESKDIVALWSWDGDGTLLIWVKGEPFACENTDCKDPYYWKKFAVKP